MNGELITLGLSLLFSGVYVYTTYDMPSQSVIFPYFILTMWSVVCVYLMVKSVLKRAKEPKGEARTSLLAALKRKETQHLLAMLVCAVVSVVLWPYLGFTISNFLFFAISMKVLGLSLKKSLLLSVALTLVYNVTFIQILDVSVPDFFKIYL